MENYSATSQCMVCRRRRQPLIGEHPRALIRQLAETKETLHIADIAELPLKDDDPRLLELAELAGARTRAIGADAEG